MFPDDELIIKKILGTEGGFSDRPADKGGPTNFGVTARTLGEYRHLGRDATAQEVKNLTRPEAFGILYQKYLEAPGLNRVVDPILRELLVDMWVNHGGKNATLVVQKAMKLPGDGVFGQNTLNAVNTNPLAFKIILAERIRFYSRIIKRDPSQIVFAEGWFDRAADFVYPN